MKKAFFIIIVLVLAGCEKKDDTYVNSFLIENQMQSERLMRENLSYVWQEIREIKENLAEYDPNDKAYKFLSPPEESWIKELGESERTRVLYNLSELRAAVAILSRRVTALEASDPNDNYR